MSAMKYFRDILMGYEKFLKIFGGPQKVFLCFLCLIFLVNSFKKSEHKMFKLILKTGHIKIQIKSTQVYLWQMVVKIQKYLSSCLFR